MLDDMSRLRLQSRLRQATGAHLGELHGRLLLHETVRPALRVDVAPVVLPHSKFAAA